MKKFAIVVLTLVLLLGIAAVVVAQGPDNRGNDCQGSQYMTSRLAGGMLARVTPGGVANRIRAEPFLSAPQTAAAEPGTPLYVTTAPACADGLLFYQVQFQDIDTVNSGIEDFGWTAEGQNGEYWLEPMLQTWTIIPNRQPINVTNSAQMQYMAEAHYGAVRNLAWTPGSGQLAIGSVGAIWLHDVNTGNANPIMVRTDGLDTNKTQDMEFSPTGDRMLTIGNSIATWNPTNGQQLSSISPYAPPQQTGLAINSAGTRAAVSVDGANINVIDAQTGAVIHTLTGHELVGEVDFSPDGSLLVSTGSAGMIASDTSLRIWDSLAGTQLAQFELGAPHAGMAFSPNGGTLAVPAQTPSGPKRPDAFVLLIDVASRNIRLSIGSGVLGGFNPRLSFNADGSVLAVSDVTSDEQGTATGYLVRLFDANNGNQLGTITLPAQVTALSFAPNGSLLAIAYEDPNFWGPNRVALWGVVQ